MPTPVSPCMADSPVKSVFGLTKSIGRRPFPEVLTASCGHRIIPIDPANPDDKRLVDAVTKAMRDFLKVSARSGVRYRGNRANDVGKQLEPTIIEEMRKANLSPTPLGGSGYPDLSLEFEGKKVYVELKTSSQKKKHETHHRLFYFTSGKKIKTDAHHLLLQVQIDEEKDKYWKVESWQLRDLADLVVGLKTEWNANYADFEGTRLLSEGS